MEDWKKKAVIGAAVVILVIIAIVVAGVSFLGWKIPSAPGALPPTPGVVPGGVDLGFLAVLIPIIILIIFFRVIAKVIGRIFIGMRGWATRRRAGKGATLYGQVLQNTSPRLPLKWAWVYVRKQGETKWKPIAATDWHGNYQFQIRPGLYEITLGHYNISSRTFSQPPVIAVELRRNDRKKIDFYLDVKTQRKVPQLLSGLRPAPPVLPVSPAEIEIQLIEPRDKTIDRDIRTEPDEVDVKVRVWNKKDNKGLARALVKLTPTAGAKIDGSDTTIERRTDNIGETPDLKLKLAQASGTQTLRIEGTTPDNRTLQTVELRVNVTYEQLRITIKVFKVIDATETALPRQEAIDLTTEAKVKAKIKLADQSDNSKAGETLKVKYWEFPGEYNKTGVKRDRSLGPTNPQGIVELPAYKPGPSGKRFYESRIVAEHPNATEDGEIYIKLKQPPKERKYIPSAKKMGSAAATKVAEKSFKEGDMELWAIFRQAYKGRTVIGKLKRVVKGGK